eukprot:1977596-Pleurochrysis_carterae.AAC.1
MGSVPVVQGHSLAQGLPEAQSTWRPTALKAQFAQDRHACGTRRIGAQGRRTRRCRHSSERLVRRERRGDRFHH